jgi:hypothetical protein
VTRPFQFPLSAHNELDGIGGVRLLRLIIVAETATIVAD